MALATGCSHECVREPSAYDSPSLDASFASKAVQLSLHCVDTEEPHYGDSPGKKPHTEKKLHPAFYGCFDWHSALHGHWAMLRAADYSENLPEKPAIVAALSRHLSRANLEMELASIGTVEDAENPYGFAWGLRLADELRRSTLPEAAAWREAYAPFERKLVQELRDYLVGIDSPVRVGLHDNTAFALTHAWDYAKGDDELRRFLEERARHFFFADHDCPLAREPAATDFLSPCFEEADLMRRVLPRGEFTSWYARFLPHVQAKQLEPVRPKHPQDYFEVHLVGLMYSKASAMSAVAHEMTVDDPHRKLLLKAVSDQIREAGKLMFDSGYGGTHWIASFAIYYYTGAGR